MRTWTALGAMVILGACGDPLIEPPEQDEAFLYLVLNEATYDHSVFVTYGQHALLLTVEGVLEPPKYRAAEEFTLTPGGSATEFAWVQYEVSTDVGSYPGVKLDGWNFFLPTDPDEGLGADDLAPSSSYDLHVQTGGIEIRGSVTIPDTFSVTVTEGSEDRLLLVWPAVPGAGGYRIEIGASPVILQPDTAYLLPADAELSRVAVLALDANLYRYSTDGQRVRSGISAGTGVLGAVSAGRMIVQH